MTHAGTFASLVGSLALALASLAGQGTSSPSPAATPAPAASPSPRERIVAEGIKLIGTTEATGKNDGAAVDRILGSVGLAGSGAPWCAAANRYVYDQAGLRDVGPRSAWSPDWVASPTWTKAKGGKTPLPGDAWGIYFSSKGRVAHTGLVEKWGTTVVTLEGNTSPDAVAGSAADRDGGGFHRKRRLQSQIYSVRSWL
jgi:hypothetical protein